MTDSDSELAADAEPADGTGDGERGKVPRAGVRRRERWPYWPAALVCVVGLAATGVLVWISASTYTNNENRLLGLRVSDAGALIIRGAARRADAARVGRCARGRHRRRRGQVQGLHRAVGRTAGRRPVRVGVAVAAGRGCDQPLAVVGAAPVLAASPARATNFFMQAAQGGKLGVVGLLSSPQPRLGYAFTSPGLTGRYVAYAESALPADRRSRLQSSSAFADLDYALYLGRSQTSANLLVTDLKKLPIRGRHASISIPFGDNVFTFVVTPRRPLGGTFPQRLPWLIAIVGLLLSVAAGAADRSAARPAKPGRATRSLARADRRGEPPAVRRAAHDRPDAAARAPARAAAEIAGVETERPLRGRGQGASTSAATGTT